VVQAYGKRRMLSVTVMTLSALVLSGFLATSASATMIISTGGKNIVTPTTNAVSGSTTTVAITPHGLWQTNNPLGRGAEWISNALTGIAPDNVFQTRAFTGNADADTIFTVNETFSVIGNAILDFTVWADDTARLWLDGALVMDWNSTQGICAVGSIGCEPSEFFNLVTNVGAGDHTIRLDTFQIGTGTTNSRNPFGILYSGEVTEVPEPGALTLFAVGLLGLGFIARRRRRTA